MLFFMTIYGLPASSSLVSSVFLMYLRFYSRNRKHEQCFYRVLVEFYLNTHANAVIWLAEPLHTISWLGVLHKIEMVSSSPNSWKHIYKQMDNQIHEKTKRRAFTVSWLKKLEIFERKWLAHKHNCKCYLDSVCAIALLAWSLAIRLEIIEIVKKKIVRILLKQLDYSFSISMSW